MVVDDYLPFKTGENGEALVYDSLPTGSGVWAAVLEKVWAKITGSYDRTDGGWTWEGIELLTDAPSTDYSYTDSNINNDPSNAWNIIYQADTKNKVMTALTGSGSDTTDNSYNLPNGHAYSLLGAYAIKDTNGNIVNRLF